MEAKTYWLYNVPMAYYKNTPEDIAEGCPAEQMKTATPSDAHTLVGYKPRKEHTYCDDDGAATVSDQTEEQFFLTASNMHYALAKDFYQLSQGQIPSVPSAPGNYLPAVEIVTASNVDTLRELIRKRFEQE